MGQRRVVEKCVMRWVKLVRKGNTEKCNFFSDDEEKAWNHLCSDV
jgi:hypothetical protein